jgi:hypothetical protein
MNHNSPALKHLARALDGVREEDEIAIATLRGVTALPDVVRAGLALTMVGGRQLRFVSSDHDRLCPPVQWCLIDAYDRLPLNDVVRTGRDVVLGTPTRFAHDYPELSARQSGSGVRSVVALALRTEESRLGGLLMYRNRELPESDRSERSLWAALAARVTDALVTGASARTDQGALASSNGTTWATKQDELAQYTHSALPADELAPGLARRFLRRTLNDWRVAEPVVDAALLCSSEVVTNVVMHVRRSSVLTVKCDGEHLAVAVHQPRGVNESSIKPVDGLEPLRVAGRGLALVDAVASRWGADSTASGTCVWFELDL